MLTHFLLYRIARPAILFAAACLFLHLLDQGSLKAESASRPNIVFIIADDLGWADVEFHGGNAPTPNLSGLAEEGLELTSHYVAPVCSPTRAGLLTGRYWSRFGITTPTNERGLPWDTMTLPKALRSQGYETCLVGKWHLGSKPQWGPNLYGFDHAYGSLAGGVTSWTHRYKKGPFSTTWHRNGTLLEEEGHVTDLLTREAVHWIDQRGEEPFFLYVPFTAIHLPINEPESWLAKVPDEITSEIGRQYAACVMHLDDSVGKILAALDRKGFRENTLVVFTSDNGGSTATNNTQPYPVDDSPPGKLTANNSPLRSQKGSVYEGGTRVPTLVSWPGKVTARMEHTPVSIVDWMPTFCGLAGYEAPPKIGWDGLDLSSLILHSQALPERTIYTAGPRWRELALRSGDWKLVTRPDEKHELYHLGKDPSEKLDLSPKNPQKVSELLGLLREAQARDKDAVVK